MAVTIITPAPTNLLTTLGRVCAELSITDSIEMQILTAMIADASSAITRECGRTSFGVQEVSETIKGSGSQLLPLTNAPILSIASIYQDTDLLDPTDPMDGYSIEDAEAGAVYRPAGWGQTVAMLSWGWEAYSSRYILPGGTSTLRYTVTYTAGYQLPNDAPTTGVPYLPGDVQQACLVTVKSWWFTRQRDFSVEQVMTGEQRIRYITDASQYWQLPAAAMGLIRDYRRVN